MNIWNLLGLQPTQDTREIRRAYAEKAKAVHPEEDPEGFQLLRAAYEQALSLAKKTENVRPEPEAPPSPAESAEAPLPAGEPEEMETPAYDFDQLLESGLQKYSAALFQRSAMVVLELCALCRGCFCRRKQALFAAYLKKDKFRQVRDLPMFLDLLSVKIQRSPVFPGWARRMIFEEYSLKALKAENRLENYACLYHAVERRENVESIVYMALWFSANIIGALVGLSLQDVSLWLGPGVMVAAFGVSSWWLYVTAKRNLCIRQEKKKE